MREIATELWLFSGFPPNAVNGYLAADVLIDAATRWGKRRLLKQLGNRSLSLVALTHVHPDHQGCAAMLCRRYQVGLACHEADVATMQGERPMQPPNAIVRTASRFWAGPPYPVSPVLHEGDSVAGFRVIHAPGHTPGHIVLFRDQDRVAIVGDVLNGMNIFTGLPGLHLPPSVFCTDEEENRRSVRRLAELEPRILCFGHGPPLRDRKAFDRFLKRIAL